MENLASIQNSIIVGSIVTLVLIAILVAIATWFFGKKKILFAGICVIIGIVLGSVASIHFYNARKSVCDVFWEEVETKYGIQPTEDSESDAVNPYEALTTEKSVPLTCIVEGKEETIYFGNSNGEVMAYRLTELK